MPSRIYVWAAPCPTCGVAKDKPCRSIAKGPVRLLYGRRTHPARRQKVREMGNPKVMPSRVTLRAPTRAIQYVQTANTINLARPQVIGTGSYATGGLVMNGTITTTTATATTGWIVTRDEMWNSWIATNTTTTGYVQYEWTDQQQVVWNNWNAEFRNLARATREAVLPVNQAMQVIQDELQHQRELHNAARLAREQEAAQLAVQAREKATELFLSLLTDEQREQWDRSEAIHVLGSEGGLYEIRGGGGVHGNISQIDEHGCRLANLCVAPQMYDYEEGDHSGRYALPTADGWVGQLLAIRFNERELREKANFSYRRGCRQAA